MISEHDPLDASIAPSEASTNKLQSHPNHISINTEPINNTGYDDNNMESSNTNRHILFPKRLSFIQNPGSSSSPPGSLSRAFPYKRLIRFFRDSSTTTHARHSNNETLSRVPRLHLDLDPEIARYVGKDP